MANLGGNWLGLVYGFAGLRVSDSELSLTNNLPNDWESLQFKLKYQARELLITLNHKKRFYYTPIRKASSNHFKWK
ncbi:glycosyl hydrolase family 65 protein [Oenococcus oeni]